VERGAAGGGGWAEETAENGASEAKHGGAAVPAARRDFRRSTAPMEAGADVSAL
jgi:hypothetical protein